MDFSAVMKLTQAWNTFKANHPKFPAFLQALQSASIREGTVIEMTVTQPDGSTIRTNIKVKQSDLELINTLKEMKIN